MLSRTVPIVLFICAILAIAPANADSWKHESGKGRNGWNWIGYGETPDWARWRGYWDGQNNTQPWGYPSALPRQAYGYQYAPPCVYDEPPYGSHDDRGKDWWKKQRKREEKAYKEWRKRFRDD